MVAFEKPHDESFYSLACQQKPTCSKFKEFPWRWLLCSTLGSINFRVWPHPNIFLADPIFREWIGCGVLCHSAELTLISCSEARWIHSDKHLLYQVLPSHRGNRYSSWSEHASIVYVNLATAVLEELKRKIKRWQKANKIAFKKKQGEKILIPGRKDLSRQFFARTNPSLEIKQDLILRE